MKKIIPFVFAIFIGFSINAQDSKKEPFKRTIKMEGRIMYDFNFLSTRDEYIHDESKFRRLRLAAKGKLSEAVSYSLDFDFTAGKIAYRNVHIRYTMPKNYGNFTFGSFDEPTGLDMLTSSKYITFIERAMMTGTQFGKYSTGFRYANQKLLDGRMGVQLAYTFSGKDAVAYQDKALEGGANFIGRVTGKVFENKEKRQLIHLGLNYEYRNDVIENFTYKSFKTENSTGNRTIISSEGNLKNTSDVGFELATTFGSLSLQSEYEMASIVTDVDTYKTTGYYAYVSYFITGEQRTYKKSIFSRVKPKTNFLDNGGLGAIELVARYSVMDLNNNLDVNNIDDNNYKVANVTLGFNWHLNSHTRFMYNFTSGNHNDMQTKIGEDSFGNDIYGQIYGGDNLIGHLFRFQVDF